MSTPTHVPGSAASLPCRTMSHALELIHAAASPPSRTVPVTHLATPPRPTAAAALPVERQSSTQPFGFHGLASHLPRPSRVARPGTTPRSPYWPYRIEDVRYPRERTRYRT